MLLTIHLVIVICTGLLVLYSDEQAFAWMLGRPPILSKNKFAMLHLLVTAGLTLLLITGGLLYIQGVSYYLSDPTFIIKMIAITALILNTYAIERLSRLATTRTFVSLSSTERIPLFISGAVSIAGWMTALVCGILLAHSPADIIQYLTSL